MSDTFTFEEWCEGIREQYYEMYGVIPARAPSLSNLDSRVQERTMRCGIEARTFNLSDYDSLAILAHYTLLRDDIKYGHQNSFWRYGP